MEDVYFMISSDIDNILTLINYCSSVDPQPAVLIIVQEGYVVLDHSGKINLTVLTYHLIKTFSI